MENVTLMKLQTHLYKVSVHSSERLHFPEGCYIRDTKSHVRITNSVPAFTFLQQ